jgi:hypothetical protein
VGSIVAVLYLTLFYDHHPAGARAAGPALRDIPVNGERSYGYLKEICAIGPRPSGSPGMLKQQELLNEHFAKLGGRVSLQSFEIRHPQNGDKVKLSNLIVEWHPERKERILLCAHYDTRPFPDRDRKKPKGRFVGANDGASGAAVLMELAHDMPGLQSRFGVDFVLFDGEEFVFDDKDKYFLGSEYFAEQYLMQPPGHTYRWGVLLDMVGDAKLEIYQEKNSVRWADTRPLVVDIWKTAKRLGVEEFIDRVRHEVRDDHLALRNIGKIPTCDIIDFDYPNSKATSYWHTEEDTPEKCSALSLAKVGWVLREWLKQAK